MPSEDDKQASRRRGKIFSNSQREYLNGKSVSENNASTKDTRIWCRVVGSLEDLQLFKDLDKRARKRIFQSNKQPEREGETLPFESDVMNIPNDELARKEGPIGLSFAFLSFFEFYHRTMRENGYTLNDQQKDLQYALEKSEQLYQNESKEGRYDVSATVEVDEPEKIDTEDALEDAKARFQEDGIHGVTSEELKALAEADYITLHGNWE